MVVGNRKKVGIGGDKDYGNTREFLSYGDINKNGTNGNIVGD